MTPEMRHAIIVECTDIVARFVQHLDRGETDACVALFAADGVWNKGDAVLFGYDALRAGWKARQRHELVRHFVSSVVISPQSPDSADGISYYICHHSQSRDRASPPVLPAPIGAPFSAGEWHDHFVRTSDGWRIARRTSHRLFQNPAGVIRY